MTDAEQLLTLLETLEAEGRTVMDLVRPGRRTEPWRLYPGEKGIFDLKTGCQFYYHAHDDGRDEDGHFHTVRFFPDYTVHLVAISMARDGWPQALFTVNLWAIGDVHQPADTLKTHVRRFLIDERQGPPTLVRFVNLMFRIFPPEIERLQSEKVAVLEAHRPEDLACPPGEDRSEMLFQHLFAAVSLDTSRPISEDAGELCGSWHGPLPQSANPCTDLRQDARLGEYEMADPIRVAVVIPALNEEGAIGEVVRDVPAGLVGDVIVVDNGSTDRTAATAAAAGARVIREPYRGYGAACRAGATAAGDADILVFLDGDRSDDPSDMPLLLRPILDNRADLVIGSRATGLAEKRALTPQQRFGNRLVTGLLRALYGLTLTDIGPFRAIRMDVFRDLGMEHRTYGWPVEMIVKAARKGYRVMEVPVSCRRRIGRSKVAGTVTGSLQAGFHLVATTLRFVWRR